MYRLSDATARGAISARISVFFNNKRPIPHFHCTDFTLRRIALCKTVELRKGVVEDEVKLHIYLLTPLSRVLLENLTVSQLVKKFPAFYGTRRFITAFTSARHLSLS